MLFLGIDQHARQITISLRDEEGDVLMARQVSTKPEKIHEFFQRLTRERLQNDEPFIAVLEVCGFNDWLIWMLYDYRCHGSMRGGHGSMPCSLIADAQENGSTLGVQPIS